MCFYASKELEIFSTLAMALSEDIDASIFFNGELSGELADEALSQNMADEAIVTAYRAHPAVCSGADTPVFPHSSCRVGGWGRCQY